jgi:hypothetical protein
MEQYDKILREKLRNYNAPFDDNAWNKMELMLRQKKNRRYFAWWWWGGTTLAAVFAALSLFVLVPKQELYNGANKPFTLAQKSHELQQIQKTESAKSVETQSNNLVALSTSRAIHNTGDANNQVEKSGRQRATHATFKNSAFTQPTKQCLKNDQHHPSVFNAHQLSEEPFYPINHSLLSTLAPNAAVQLTSASNQLSLQCEQDENSVLLPVKKKKYRYELGVNSGVFAVALNKNFMHQPSWFLGVQEAYRFGKYIAFTDGFYYSQTSLSQQFPSTDSIADLKKFSNKFHALTLALGVNVYPVSSSKIDWYLGAGLFNNFKVNEAISYDVDYQKTTFDNLGNIVPVTNLNSGSLESAISEAELKKGYGTKFYTANLYASTGIEAKIYKGLRFNAGVQYQLGLFKTVDKQSHPHFVGGELGLRYRF